MSPQSPAATLDTVAASLSRWQPTVLVRGETGTDLDSDWWSMRLEELDIAACEYGLDATAAALCREVAQRVRDDVLNGSLQERQLGLTLHLFLAAERDDLADMLQAAQHLDFEDEISAEITSSAQKNESQVAGRRFHGNVWRRIVRSWPW
jgi:hypothetical protein